MAATFIGFDQTTPFGNRSTSGVRQVYSGVEQLRQALAMGREMIDGDGSDASHFALYASKNGFQANGYASANAAAKAHWDELNSLYAKLTATGVGNPVVDVGPAVTQAFARIGA